MNPLDHTAFELAKNPQVTQFTMMDRPIVAYPPILKLRAALDERFKTEIGLCEAGYFKKACELGLYAQFGCTGRGAGLQGPGAPPPSSHSVISSPTQFIDVPFSEKETLVKVTSDKLHTEEEVKNMREMIKSFRQYQTVGGRDNFYGMIGATSLVEKTVYYYYETPEYIKERDEFAERLNDRYEDYEKGRGGMLAERDINCIVHCHNRDWTVDPLVIDGKTIYTQEKIDRSYNKAEALIRKLYEEHSVSKIKPFDKLGLRDLNLDVAVEEFIKQMSFFLGERLERKMEYIPGDSFVSLREKEEPSGLYKVTFVVFSTDIEKFFDELVSFINTNM